MPVLHAHALRAFVADIFTAAGCSAAESARVAASLVSANLTGHDSHGVVRVPRYVAWLREGLVVPDVTPRVERESAVTAVVDGGFGFGQTAAPFAVRIGVGKALASGLAAVALKNSGHIGRVGEWAEMAAAEGVISIHFVNVQGSLLVAPFGGVDRRLSTAPFCIGMPIAGGEPIILDFATSLVAEGKVLVASRGGPPVPADSLILPDGRLTGDPAALYGDISRAERNPEAGAGAIRAFGLHKGSGLAVLCELLAGAVSGNGTAGPREGGRGRISNGMLSFYLCPDAIDDTAAIAHRAERFLAFCRSSRPDRPGGEVLMPGEPERRRRAERDRHGIPLPDEVWNALLATAHSVGLGPDRIPPTQ
ncbi:MAG: malate/lactate/ureidoglycolate dehydrogenase [Elioraea sp.]|nr:malate/lactate/ureidoglycolate dehydrogenase [Elioraea sp.]MDW8444442.1 malate/lactate/ureidoglycolate dehydrogenase [Acetobacteraceae bacterium]